MKKPVQEQEDKYVLSKMTLTVITDYIAPYLSDIDVIKEQQIEDIIQCYKLIYPNISEKDIKVLRHLDRAFHRMSDCTPFVSARAVTAALRHVLNNNEIDVLGFILFPPKSVYVTTASVNVYNNNKSTTTYEYIKPGTVTSALVKVKGIEIPFETKVVLGASKNKGYGQVSLKFEKIELK